jgi:hypothetical protein
MILRLTLNRREAVLLPMRKRACPRGMTYWKLLRSMCTICACPACLALGPPAALAEVPPARDFPGTLALPRLIDAEVPETGTPITQLRIASGFFGCWEGNPGEFASVIGASGEDSPGALRRVVRCYLPGQIETQEFGLELVSRHPICDKVRRVLSLGYRRVRVKEASIKVYRVNANQVYSRGTMKIELTESSLFKWPRTMQHTVVDEEIATLVNPDLVLIAARAFVTTAKGPVSESGPPIFTTK